MNFIAGALIIDCITSNRRKSDSGSSALGILIILGYLIYQLPKMQQTLTNKCIGNEQLIISLLIGCTVMIPVYMKLSNNRGSGMCQILLRVIIYLDVFVGLLFMLMISKTLGMNPASYIFNINKITNNINNNNFFISTVSTFAYPLIKLLDLILIVGLIPAFQLLLNIIFVKSNK